MNTAKALKTLTRSSEYANEIKELNLDASDFDILLSMSNETRKQNYAGFGTLIEKTFPSILENGEHMGLVSAVLLFIKWFPSVAEDKLFILLDEFDNFIVPTALASMKAA